ncbi:hypothetical protein [Sphingobacterium siyangense]|uniref:hypothetical protein n=1 Tax=Sphingobacterium siyangense TaxID=459529 RepID=UPI002FDDC33A
MNTITKILAGIFGMMMLLTVQNVQAQWTTVKAHVQGSDIKKVSGISFDSYKGMESGTFEIVASVTEVRDKEKVNFQLRTQSINLVSYDSYSYHPYPEVIYCSGTDGELQERPYTNAFLPRDIGADAFEQAKKSASATFDVEISFIVKDDKYGIAGAGYKKGWGYRANRIFKNVSANSVFWADESIETTYPIEDIKIVMQPKLVSFNANESALQTGVENFIAEKKKQAEKECNEKAKANDADKKKKDEENKKAEASAKEIEAMKNKLQNQINITGNKTKADDFWSGGTDKNTASAGKSNDDFWAGGDEKTQTTATKPSNSKGIKGYEREEEWYAVGVTQYSPIRGFKSHLKSAEWKIEPMEMQKYGIEYESFVPKSEYQIRGNNLNSVFRGKYIVAGFGTGSKNYSHCSGYNDYQLQPTRVINRKGDVVMESKLEDGFIVLGNTHLVVKLKGKRHQTTNMYYEACSNEVLDIRNGRKILELTNNRVYNNNNSYWTSEGAFFIDSDEAVTYYSQYRVESRRVLPSFLENVKQEMAMNNFIGCLGYYEGYEKTTGGKMVVIFFKDDGTYLEKRNIPIDVVLSEQKIR